MALDYAVHATGNLVGGNLPPAPYGLVLAGQKSLAELTDSAVITIDRPAVLACTATVKLRIDIQRNGTALDPANSPIVLAGDQVRYFTIDKGSWKIRTAIYA